MTDRTNAKMSPIIMADGCSFCGTNGISSSNNTDTTDDPEGHNKKSAVLYRCKGCQLVQYCNRTCQKRHWRASHKHSCRAGAAQTELQRLWQHTSISEAVEYGSKANSNLSLQQQKEEEEEKETTTNARITTVPTISSTTVAAIAPAPAASVEQDILTSIQPTESRRIRSHTKQVASKEVVANNVFEIITPSRKEVPIMVHGFEEKVRLAVPEPYCQNVLLEHMTHIGCLSITLLFPTPVVSTTTTSTTTTGQTIGEERNIPLPLNTNHDADIPNNNMDVSFLRNHVHVQVLDHPGIPANQKDASSCLRVWSRHRSHGQGTDPSQNRTMKQGASPVRTTHEWVLLASFRIPGTVLLPSNNNETNE
eukprot:scaffold569678_cov59-Attheya_sp.AAC.1